MHARIDFPQNRPDFATTIRNIGHSSAFSHRKKVDTSVRDHHLRTRTGFCCGFQKRVVGTTVWCPSPEVRPHHILPRPHRRELALLSLLACWVSALPLERVSLADIQIPLSLPSPTLYLPVCAIDPIPELKTAPSKKRTKHFHHTSLGLRTREYCPRLSLLLGRRRRYPLPSPPTPQSS